jgi:hypothetical protein
MDVGKGREQERKLLREFIIYGWKPGMLFMEGIRAHL